MSHKGGGRGEVKWHQKSHKGEEGLKVWKKCHILFEWPLNLMYVREENINIHRNKVDKKKYYFLKSDAVRCVFISKILDLFSVRHWRF
jgi:hypothetical protein